MSRVKCLILMYILTFHTVFDTVIYSYDHDDHDHVDGDVCIQMACGL